MTGPWGSLFKWTQQILPKDVERPLDCQYAVPDRQRRHAFLNEVLLGLSGNVFHGLTAVPME